MYEFDRKILKPREVLPHSNSMAVCSVPVGGSSLSGRAELIDRLESQAILADHRLNLLPLISRDVLVFQ